MSQQELEDAVKEQVMMFNAPAFVFDVLHQQRELIAAASSALPLSKLSLRPCDKEERVIVQRHTFDYWGHWFFWEHFLPGIPGWASSFGINKLTLVSRNASRFATKNGLAVTKSLQFRTSTPANCSTYRSSAYLMHFAASSSKATYSQNAINECENIRASIMQTVAAVQAARKPIVC